MKANKAKAWLVCCEKSQTVNSDSSDRETEEPKRAQNKAKKQVDNKAENEAENKTDSNVEKVEYKMKSLMTKVTNKVKCWRKIPPREKNEETEGNGKTDPNQMEDQVRFSMSTRVDIENKKPEIESDVKNEMENEMENQMEKAENKLEIKVDIEYKMENKIEDEIEDKAENKMEGNIENEIKNEVENQMEAENKLKIKADVKYKMKNKIDDQVDKTKNKAENKMEGDIENEIKNEVEIGSNVDNKIENQHKRENILVTSHISKTLAFSFELRDMQYEYSITVTLCSYAKINLLKFCLHCLYVIFRYRAITGVTSLTSRIYIFF